MENAVSSKLAKRDKSLFILFLVIGSVLLLLLLWNLFGGNSYGKVQQTTNSDLISTKEIANLSVSEFVYNGIAQTYQKNGSHDYNVLFKSTVKVSVDADGIRYDVDDEKKLITFILPEFKIEKPVIDVSSLKTIPNKNDLYMDDIIKLCREDALKEASNSEQLVSSAQENLRSIIKAWYSPIFEGYSFEYQFITAEGGKGK